MVTITKDWTKQKQTPLQKTQEQPMRQIKTLWRQRTTELPKIRNNKQTKTRTPHVTTKHSKTKDTYNNTDLELNNTKQHNTKQHNTKQHRTTQHKLHKTIQNTKISKHKDKEWLQSQRSGQIIHLSTVAAQMGSSDSNRVEIVFWVSGSIGVLSCSGPVGYNFPEW